MAEEHKYAWGENIGWISFDASGPISYKVTTSWRLDADKDGIPDCNDNTPFEGPGGLARNESNSDGCFISTLGDEGMMKRLKHFFN